MLAISLARPRFAHCSIFFAVLGLLFLFPTDLSAQSIPLTTEILTDGHPETGTLTGPNGQTTTPSSSQEWTQVTGSRSLQFGQDFNFDFNHATTGSSNVSTAGGSSVASSSSAGGSMSSNMYTTRYATTTAAHDSDSDSGNCDGWACISCGYSASCSSTSTFASGSYGAFSKRNDAGSFYNEDYECTNNISDWTFSSGSALSTYGGTLRKTGGSSTSASLNCGGSYNNACDCGNSTQVNWMNTQSGSIGLFHVYDAASCSGNCGSCSVSTQTMGCFNYNVASTNGAANFSQYVSTSGTIGSDVWIDLVEADFTGDYPTDIDLWLRHGQKKSTCTTTTPTVGRITTWISKMAIPLSAAIGATTQTTALTAEV
jgi:hypothetical protein